MTTSRRIGILAFAMQSAKGTPATAAQFAVPIVSGGIAPVRDRSRRPVTTSQGGLPGMHITGARGEGTVEIEAYPDALGMLLYELLGSQSVSGAGVPYSHVFAMANGLPSKPLTVWSLVGDDWWRFADCFIPHGVLRGGAQGVFTFSADFFALAARRVSAAPAYPTTLLNDDDPARLKYIGAAVSLDADGDTPLLMDNVESVELDINRNPQARYGTGLTPGRLHVDRGEVSFTATFDKDDTNAGGINNQGWDFLAGAALGQVANNADVSQDLLQGSFKVVSGRHPEDATRHMTFYPGPATTGHAAPYADLWEYDVTRPESDPAGGPLQMTASGFVKQPLTGSEVTIVIPNEVAAAYSETVPTPAS